MYRAVGLDWLDSVDSCDPASLSCYGPIYNISHPSFSPSPLPKSPATVRKHLSLSAGPQSALDCQLRFSSHHHHQLLLFSRAAWQLSLATCMGLSHTHTCTDTLFSFSTFFLQGEIAREVRSKGAFCVSGAFN